MSPYASIRDGVKYPAALFEHGVNDIRVDVWMTLKTASRLAAATASGRPVLLRLEYDGGHGVGGTRDAGPAAHRRPVDVPAVAVRYRQAGAVAIAVGADGAPRRRRRAVA